MNNNLCSLTTWHNNKSAAQTLLDSQRELASLAITQNAIAQALLPVPDAANTRNVSRKRRRKVRVRSIDFLIYNKNARPTRNHQLLLLDLPHHHHPTLNRTPKLPQSAFTLKNAMKMGPWMNLKAFVL